MLLHSIVSISPTGDLKRLYELKQLSAMAWNGDQLEVVEPLWVDGSREYAVIHTPSAARRIAYPERDGRCSHLELAYRAPDGWHLLFSSTPSCPLQKVGDQFLLELIDVAEAGSRLTRYRQLVETPVAADSWGRLRGSFDPSQPGAPIVLTRVAPLVPGQVEAEAVEVAGRISFDLDFKRSENSEWLMWRGADVRIGDPPARLTSLEIDSDLHPVPFTERRLWGGIPLWTVLAALVGSLALLAWLALRR